MSVPASVSSASLSYKVTTPSSDPCLGNTQKPPDSMGGQRPTNKNLQLHQTSHSPCLVPTWREAERPQCSQETWSIGTAFILLAQPRYSTDTVTLTYIQTRGSGVPSLSILGIFEPLGWRQALLCTCQHSQWTLEGHLTALWLRKGPCILTLSQVVL